MLWSLTTNVVENVSVWLQPTLDNHWELGGTIKFPILNSETNLLDFTVGRQWELECTFK